MQEDVFKLSLLSQSIGVVIDYANNFDVESITNLPLYTHTYGILRAIKSMPTLIDDLQSIVNSNYFSSFDALSIYEVIRLVKIYSTKPYLEIDIPHNIIVMIQYLQKIHCLLFDIEIVRYIYDVSTLYAVNRQHT